MYSSYQYIPGNRKSAEHLRIHRTWYIFIYFDTAWVIDYFVAYIIAFDDVQLHEEDKGLHAEMNIDLQEGTVLCSALAIQKSH